MKTRALLLAALATLSLALWAGSASAAGNGLRFEPTAGSAIPLAGNQTFVDVECGSSKQVCAGDVELVPRGSAEEELGTAPVATSGRLKAAPGADLQPKLELSAAAGAWVEANGPLPVTADLQGPGPDPTRQFVVEDVKLVSAPAPNAKPTPSPFSLATASAEEIHLETFEWNFNLRPGTAVALRQFHCPSDKPYVKEGTKGYGIGTAADIKVKASDGVGYGAFRNVDVRERQEVHPLVVLLGWPQGDLFSNNVFAPPFRSGTFSMSLTCTSEVRSVREDNTGAATQYVQSRNRNHYPTAWLLPWNSPHGAISYYTW
jgi:hypothetical protein